jgi:hypothetical protein
MPGKKKRKTMKWPPKGGSKHLTLGGGKLLLHNVPFRYTRNFLGVLYTSVITYPHPHPPTISRFPGTCRNGIWPGEVFDTCNAFFTADQQIFYTWNAFFV